MQDQTLLRRQKNEIFNQLTLNALSPHEFQWLARPSLTTDSWEVSCLQHIPTKYYLTFDRKVEGGSDPFQDSYHSPVMRAHLHGSPGVQNKHIDAVIPLDEWDEQVLFADLWMKCLKAEYTAPDLWGAVDTAREFLDSMTVRGLENTPFSDSEKAIISKQLSHIKGFLQKKYSEDTKKLENIENSIDHLVNASQTMGRKDWSMTAMSVLITLGAGFYFAVSPTDFSILSEYASLIKNLFSFLFTISPPLIQ